jgi:hypothetical protein
MNSGDIEKGTTRTPDIIARQHDGHIEGQQISGETAGAPAFPPSEYH